MEYYYFYLFQILLFALDFLQNIVYIIAIMAIQIISIIVIIHIIAIISFWSHLHKKLVYGYRYWVEHPECIRIYQRQRSKQKYCEIQLVAAPLPVFWLTPPRNRRLAPSLTRCRAAPQQPAQLHDRDTTEPQIRQDVYLADALPREPSRVVREQREQTVAWPNPGDATSSHGTFLHLASRAADP